MKKLSKRLSKMNLEGNFSLMETDKASLVQRGILHPIKKKFITESFLLHMDMRLFMKSFLRTKRYEVKKLLK